MVAFTLWLCHMALACFLDSKCFWAQRPVTHVTGPLSTTVHLFLLFGRSTWSTPHGSAGSTAAQSTSLSFWLWAPWIEAQCHLCVYCWSICLVDFLILLSVSKGSLTHSLLLRQWAYGQLPEETMVSWAVCSTSGYGLPACYSCLNYYIELPICIKKGCPLGPWCFSKVAQILSQWCVRRKWV